jgi:redox-sensitive bicupin YhaK (pirin superfamily)
MPSGSRARTRTDWLDSAHSFSYGPHYDPSNTHFGPLLACNEDVLAPNTGFDAHPHAELEIVTWVIGGSLVHTDTTAGGNALLRKGHVGMLSAGSGVTHSEYAGSDGAHYLQMWVQPDQPGRLAQYRTVDLTEELATPRLVPVTTHPNATLFAARLPRAAGIAVPGAPMRHVFIVSGSVVLAEQQLHSSDAARITGGTDLVLNAVTDSEILLWQLQDSI